jgi:hypothetical protein
MSNGASAVPKIFLRLGPEDLLSVQQFIVDEIYQAT